MIYLDKVNLPIHLGTIFIWISACITESNIQKWTINTKLKLNWNWISDNLYKTPRSHLRQVTGWGIKQCIEQTQSDTRTHTHTHHHMYTHTHTHTHMQRHTHTNEHSIPDKAYPKLLLFCREFLLSYEKLSGRCPLGAYWRMLCFMMMMMMMMLMMTIMMMKIKIMTMMMMMTWWW